MPTLRLSHKQLEELFKANPALAERNKVDSKVKPRKPKYGNNKVEWEGETFDSTKEFKRYKDLLLLQKAGKIGQLRRQVKYLLIPASEEERKCEYWADFTYLDAETGELVVEDAKSEPTRKLSTYIIKRKLMKQVHGITIKEV